MCLGILSQLSLQHSCERDLLDRLPEQNARATGLLDTASKIVILSNFRKSRITLLDTW